MEILDDAKNGFFSEVSLRENYFLEVLKMAINIVVNFDEFI